MAGVWPDICYSGHASISEDRIDGQGYCGTGEGAGMKDLFDPKMFGLRVRGTINWTGHSMRTAAGQMQVSPATLSRVQRGYAPSVEVYLRIVRWLDAVDGSRP